MRRVKLPTRRVRYCNEGERRRHAASAWRASAALLLGATLLSCSSSDPREGRTRLVIDTDLPTPEVASRVRIDLYRADGTWFDSRGEDTSQPRAFPVSFDLAAPTEGEVTIRVRVRIFPDGYTRPYKGERFQDWPAVLGDPGAPSDGPRLLVDGQDQTPESEPIPGVTVDRLLTLTARAGQAREVGVVLRGRCAGMMADLKSGTTCAAQERQREPAAEPTDVIKASLTDSLREPCTKEPGAGRVCVPGGVFVLGDRGQPKLSDEGGFLMDGRPERLVRVRRFHMDDREVTVGRYRALDAAGFRTSRYNPRDNNGALSDDPTSPTSCTYTEQAGEREQHPLNCLTWGAFRELCQYEGGDLPTEAQWEYAAALAGGVSERRYPWGDDEPVCNRVVFARVGSKEENYCATSPALVSVYDPGGDGDRTPLGLLGLGGSVSEFVLDRPAAYTDASWTEARFEGPFEENPIGAGDEVGDEDRFMLRGGSWVSPANTLRAGFRLQGAAASPFYGARCVYPSP